MIERPHLAELNRSWERISARCATEQRVAGRHALFIPVELEKLLGKLIRDSTAGL